MAAVGTEKSAEERCLETEELNGQQREDTESSPINASLQVGRLLKLSAAQVSVLSRELDATDENPVLVVQVNPAWVTIHGQAAADDVLDFIGEFEMDAPYRRDPEAARRFVYHFAMTSDIGNCRAATLAMFPLAFALSSNAAQVAAAFGASGVPVIPLAFCAVIHKIAVRQCDVQRSTFFCL